MLGAGCRAPTPVAASMEAWRVLTIALHCCLFPLAAAYFVLACMAPAPPFQKIGMSIFGSDALRRHGVELAVLRGPLHARCGGSQPGAPGHATSP